MPPAKQITFVLSADAAATEVVKAAKERNFLSFKFGSTLGEVVVVVVVAVVLFWTSLHFGSLLINF